MKVMTRLPGVMLDIWEFRQQTLGPHVPDRGQPAWYNIQYIFKLNISIVLCTYNQQTSTNNNLVAKDPTSFINK